MSGFLNYPGYRNVFSCVSCEMSRDDYPELRCIKCLSYCCEHLMLAGEGGKLCFCCCGYPEGQDNWPDWCFTMLPGSKRSE
jgi:hypothetical protein